MTHPLDSELVIIKRLFNLAIDVLATRGSEETDDKLSVACQAHVECEFCLTCKQYESIGFIPNSTCPLVSSSALENKVCTGLLLEFLDINPMAETYADYEKIVRTLFSQTKYSLGQSTDVCPTKLLAIRTCLNWVIDEVSTMLTPNEILDQNMVNNTLRQTEYKSPYQTIDSESDVSTYFPSHRAGPKCGSCCICLEDIKEGEEIYTLKCCGASFHYEEFCTYLGINGLACPICRSEIKK